MRSLTGIVEQNLRPHPKANQNGMERPKDPDRSHRYTPGGGG